MMEHHKCKLFRVSSNELFDDNAECWFEEVREESGIRDVQGEVQSSQHLFGDMVTGEGEYLMELDDGRRGRIIIKNVTSSDTKRAIFMLSGGWK